MKKVYVTLEVQVCLQVEGDVDVNEAIDNLDISARPCEEYLDDMDVLDTQLLDYTITDVK